VHLEGFAAVYARAIEIAIHTMRDQTLKNWTTPPLLLLQPRVEHLGMFAFAHVVELMDEGYRTAREAFSDPAAIPPPDASGIYPRRRVHLRVERDRCVGCGACLVYGGHGTFSIDGSGKAVVNKPDQIWSPVDGTFVRQCPTYAIVAREEGKGGKEP
jgi:ferredoxin